MNKKVIVGFLVSTLVVGGIGSYFIFFNSNESVVEVKGKVTEKQVSKMDFKNFQEFNLIRNENFEKGLSDIDIVHNEEYVYGNEKYHITYTTWNSDKKRVMYIEDREENKTYATKRFSFDDTIPKAGLINWVFQYKDKLYGMNLLGNIVEVKFNGAEISILGEDAIKTKIKNANFLGIEGDYIYLREGEKLYSYNLEEKKETLLLKSKKYTVTDVFYNGHLILKDREGIFYLAKAMGERLHLIEKLKGEERDKAYFKDNNLYIVGENIYKYTYKK